MSKLFDRVVWQKRMFLWYKTPLKEFDFYLFADDANLPYAEKDLNKLEVVVNEELLMLCE